MSAQGSNQPPGAGEAHPWLLAALTLAAAVMATIVLLASGQGPIILYQAF